MKAQKWWACATGVALTLMQAAAAPPAGVATSPVVENDGKVTFYYQAGAPTRVEAVGQFGPRLPLQKGRDGWWRGTTEAPVAPGVWEYHMEVDGISLIDPLNPEIKPQRWPGASILSVPASPPAAWDLREIPHGTVHEHEYQARALKGQWRRLTVYTPPGVEAGKPAAKLPVLYLSHGFSDNDRSWTVHGRAHWILDALLAEGKVVPMILVMPDGHSVPPPLGTWSDDYGARNTESYVKELIEDVIPFVEAHYPVKSDPLARAFAGLSMGGHHALVIALREHPRFAWIGAFSAATPDRKTLEAGLADVPGINRDLKLLWIACGKDDFLYERNVRLHEALTTAGVKHEWILTEGTHSWPVWRNYLLDLTPKLFRE